MFYSVFERVYDWLYAVTPVCRQVDSEIEDPMPPLEDADSKVTEQESEINISVTALGFESPEEDNIMILPHTCFPRCDYVSDYDPCDYESSCEWLHGYLKELSTFDEFMEEDVPSHVDKVIESWERTKESRRSDSEYDKKLRKKQSLTAKYFAKQLYKKSMK